MSVKSKMTAIADAVRTLRGLSGTMGLDAMATNIDGANTAVEDALAALTEKGVTVPDGTTVDGLADLIAAIESGGGSGVGGGISLMRYTPAENMTKPVISHSLGSVPAAAIIIAESDPDDVAMTSKTVVYGFTKGTYHNTAPYNSTSRLSTWSHEIKEDYDITSNINGMVSYILFCNATETSIKVLNGGNTALTAGVTYLIILFAEGVWA